MTEGAFDPAVDNLE